MKIAMVLNTSWNVYNFRMGLLNALRNEGHEMIVMAPEDRYSRYIADAGYAYHPIRMDRRGINPVSDIALLLELRRAYRKHKPDLILHYTIKPNIYGTFAAASCRIPVINNVCGLGTAFMKNNLVTKVASSLYRMAFRYPHKVFFQNDADLELFLKNQLVKEKITALVPGSGISLNDFPAVKYSRNDVFTFLVISRLILDKGILEYVEAARKLRTQGINARFQLLGAMDPEHRRGIQPEKIREWVDDQTVEYLGTTDDVRSYIGKADCVVLPSYREGTPRSLLEAACMEKPIIATDVAGCHHVVEHGFNGLLCAVRSAEDLAAKMKEMIAADENTLEQYGKNGRRKMEKEFDERLVIGKYLDSIRSMHK